MAARPRTVYEMQQVLPGADPDEPWSDPVLRAAELLEGGEPEEARDALMILLHQDLRCLDAHAHLGNWSFSEYTLDTALAHYEVGVRIGEQSLGAAFDGPLDNQNARVNLLAVHEGGLWDRDDDEHASA